MFTLQKLNSHVRDIPKMWGWVYNTTSSLGPLIWEYTHPKTLHYTKKI
jgi:hypothetical protein